jgi:hypothetical protein
MIIKIEDTCGDKLLCGKELTFSELQSAVKEIFEKHDENRFAAEFCARYGYKELPYAAGYFDYLIDISKRLAFVTKHTFPRMLDNARVLYCSDRGMFDPICYVGGGIAHNVYYFAICKYDNDGAYYVFSVDENLEVVGDSCWDSVETCMEVMERYGVEWHEHKESK